VRAAEYFAVRLDAVTNHPAFTVLTSWSELLNGTFKTIKGVGRPTHHDCKGTIVLIAASFAW